MQHELETAKQLSGGSMLGAVQKMVRQIEAKDR